jgi:hypothetical protein
MTLREACDQVRAVGCTNLWFLFVWKPARYEPITDEFITRYDRAQQRERPGVWEVRSERYIYFIPNNAPTVAVRVFYAA